MLSRQGAAARRHASAGASIHCSSAHASRTNTALHPLACYSRRCRVCSAAGRLQYCRRPTHPITIPTIAFLSPLPLQLTSGAVVEGVFNTLKRQANDVAVVLKWARTIRDPNCSASDRQEAAEKPCKFKIIQGHELVQVGTKQQRTYQSVAVHP